MKLRLMAIVLTCLTLVIGCNGSSGENPVTPDVAEVATIALVVQNSTGQEKTSFDKNEDISLIATAYDASNRPIANQRINFEVDLGELSQSSKLTDANGDALITLSNETLSIGAGTATASFGDITTNQFYEFVNNDTPETPSKITTNIRLNGVSVSQFKADEQVLVTSTLLDSNDAPIAGEIISFTADVGTLSTSTALTDFNGIASVSLTGGESIGAGIITATYSESESSAPTNSVNYEIISADAIVTDSNVRIGYFDSNSSFVEGKIKLSVDNNTISAGGTLGLSVDLVDSEDNKISTPTPVTFTSNCVLNNNAVIDETVFSVRGNAQATFEDNSCAGVSGTSDVIIASITVNGVTNTADADIEITGEQLGSIEFISAEPNSIVLKGTGGQGKQETSTLTFRVKSNLNNVLAQQEVSFSLDTEVGGITLSRNDGLTNSQGLVTTQVLAGSVPTSVRVTAKATMEVNGESIDVQSQSDILSVNTGLPEQRSFTIGASVFNPEADLYNGEESVITARLADNFNNPVPDGTTVSFTTEGGVIEPSCTTTNGACSVTWTSAEPREDDHRITILATALGHETFFDSNGNNVFDNNDGEAVVKGEVSSGMERHIALPSGFIDMSEAWRDDNENNTRDTGEAFLDYNNDNSFTTEDGVFNGPQCIDSACADENNRAIHVRKALILIMSGSNANFALTSDGTVYEDSSGTSATIPDIANNTFRTFQFSFSDEQGEVLPFGTNVSVTTTEGLLQGVTNYTVPNTKSSGHYMEFSLINRGNGGGAPAVLSITITTQKGHVTQVPLKSINLL